MDSLRHSGDRQHTRSHAQIDRRLFIAKSLFFSATVSQGTLMAIKSQLDFGDRFVPGETIVGKELERTIETQQGTETIRITITAPLEWKVNDQDHAMTHLIVDGCAYPPSAGIPSTDYTIENGAKDIIASQDGSGIDIMTSVGVIHLSMEEFDKALWALAHPEPVMNPQDNTVTTVNIAVDIEPNADGRLALSLAQGCNAANNLLALTGITSRSKAITLPKSVGIEFTSNTPPPVMKYDVSISPEKIAAFQQKRDAFIALFKR